MSKQKFCLAVKPVSESSIVSEIQRQLYLDEIPYACLKEISLFEYVITKDTTIMYPPKNDCDCINDPEYVEIEITPQMHNIKRDESGSLYALCDGLPVLDRNGIKIYRVKYEGVFNIITSDDSLSAYMNVYPPAAGFTKFTYDDVLMALEKKGIKFGIDKDAIRNIASIAVEEGLIVNDVKVASGIKKEDGTDSWIEYFISTEKDYSPTTTEDGRLDFHNINVIELVEINQLLARYYPAVEGVSGKDIFGNVIPAEKPVILTFPSGEGTYVPEDDKYGIYAKTSGSILVKNGKINVSEMFRVDGNVDFKTGNITYHESLKVKEDVLSGFALNIGGNIEIGGCVEDALIRSGGSVCINRGFAGKGTGIIEANSFVKIKYIRNQKVFSRDSIFITNEAINANLCAKNDIVVGGRTMSIVGGYAIAGKSITVQNLGNEYGVHTMVELGYDYETKVKLENDQKILDEKYLFLKDRNTAIRKIATAGKLSEIQIKTLFILFEQELSYSKLLARDKSVETELKQIRSGIRQISCSLALDQDCKAKFAKLIEEQISVMKETEKLKESIAGYEKEMYCRSRASLTIKKTVYPGTIISINMVKLAIDRPYQNKQFYLSEDGEIVSV